MPRGRRAAVTARFRLSSAATVRWTLERRRTSARRGEHWVPVARGRWAGRAGAQDLTIRLGGGAGPGTYRVTLVARATAAGAASAPKHLRFTVTAS